MELQGINAPLKNMTLCSDFTIIIVTFISLLYIVVYIVYIQYIVMYFDGLGYYDINALAEDYNYTQISRKLASLMAMALDYRKTTRSLHFSEDLCVLPH